MLQEAVSRHSYSIEQSTSTIATLVICQTDSHVYLFVSDHGAHYWSTDEGSTFSHIDGALAYGCEVQYTDVDIQGDDSNIECLIMVRIYIDYPCSRRDRLRKTACSRCR